MNLVSERGGLIGPDGDPGGPPAPADSAPDPAAPPLAVAATAHRVLPMLRGAFSLVFMDERTLYAARDPYGVRPLAPSPSSALMRTTNFCCKPCPKRPPNTAFPFLSRSSRPAG